MTFPVQLKRRAALASAVLVLLLASCQTVPTQIPEDLEQSELIQLAQDSADAENWEAAIAYYTAIQERFTQDRAAVATATYEIAFIEYKRGELEAASTGFKRLIGMYEMEADVLPAWPRILAEKLLTQIEKESAPG